MGDNSTKDTGCAPPSKKQRTDNQKSTKENVFSKSGHKKKIRMFFQTPDFTTKQIENILENTKKDRNRPLILFADNDWDNYFLQKARFFKEYKTNTGYKHKRDFDKELQIHNCTDINTQLLAKYDNIDSDDFLSFGIVTYFQNKKGLRNWKNFKANVNANFRVLKCFIKKHNILELIIPSKYPITKKKGVIHKLNGFDLKHKHLKYIQTKIDELESLFVKEYVFTDYKVMYGVNHGMNHNDLFAQISKNKQMLKRDNDEQTDQDAECHTVTTVTPVLTTETISNNEADLEIDETETETAENERIVHSLRPALPQFPDSTQTQPQNPTINENVLMERVMQQNCIIQHQAIELDFMHKRLVNSDIQKHGNVSMRNFSYFKPKNRLSHAYYYDTNSWIICLFVLVVFIALAILVFICRITEMETDIVIPTDTAENTVSISRIGNIVAILSCIGLFLSIYYSNNVYYGQWKKCSNYAFIIVCIAMVALIVSSMVMSVSHATDMSDNFQFLDNLLDTILWYLFGLVLWIWFVHFLSQKISEHNSFPAFIVMSIGGPSMFVGMHIVHEIISQIYGINGLPNERRLEIFSVFITNVLLPIIVVAMFIGHLIQWASHSAQLRQYINWRMFAKLCLGMVALYAMMYRIRAVFYVVLVCSLAYIIKQCLTVSWINHSNAQSDGQTRVMPIWNPYSAEWQLQQTDLY